MEATEAKTELVSPPQAHLPWGDNSPLLGTNSPHEEVFFGKIPPTETSTDNRTEQKQITDGFLSEVSTPDHGPSQKKQPLSPERQKKDDQSSSRISRQNRCTKDKDEERNVFDISPPKALTDMSGDLLDGEEFKGEAVFFFSRRKVEEVLQDPPLSTEMLQRRNIVKEEPRTTNGNSFEAPDLLSTSEAPSGTEVEQSTATALKRKRFFATEGKLRRKRLKTSISERSRTKGAAQWSHLSEEELKKLRRVKNRESVERCRTKQRLRMEALQVEQTCLRLENKKLGEATTSIRAALQDISVEMTRLKDHVENHDKEGSGRLEKELRREIHA